MNLKRSAIFCIAALAAVAAVAAPTTKSAYGKKTGKAAPAAAADEEGGSEANVKIEIFPKLGRAAALNAPSLPGESLIGSVYSKQRKWIVLEAKYQTYDKVVDQLTFTWHVLLETKTATVKDKDMLAKRAPYSYFTQRVTYSNIPKGFHAASVCLHPSYYEQYGEPKAVGIVVTDASGKVLAGDCESEIQGIESHPKSIEAAFWNDDKIMNAKNPKSADGDPMIERRQGLQDRSKTIWALVNPNDYELVLQ